MKNVFILFLLISVSIAEILPGSNGIGYDYPKPITPFETGVIKKLVELPKPTYLPPTETTTRARPTSVIAKKVDIPKPTYLPPATTTKPQPVIAKKVEDIPKPTYLPPATTSKPTIKTTKITPPPIKTTKPIPKIVVAKKEENDGYKYPAPEVRLVLPTKPSPVVAKKVVDIPKPTYLPPATTNKPSPVVAKKVVDIPKPTYLPPATTTKPTIKTTKITLSPVTTTKSTPTTTRPKIVVAKKEENDGYKYPAPEVRLVLPTKPSPVVTKKVVDIPKPTYLPPVTTTKTTIKTTKITPPPVTTTKPAPKIVVAKKEENDGYKYPAPEVRLVLPTKPSPVVTKKVVDIPKPTYLPPVTTTKTTIKTTKITPPPITTTKPTPTTIRPKTVVEKKEENDGYKYPAPEVRLVLPTKPSPVVTKKVVDIPKPTYLPPVTTTKTTIKTTKITPPPVTKTKPAPTTIRPKPVVEKKEENDGYKYPAPEVRLVLPTKPSPVVTKKVVDIPKPTYLPPVTTTKTTIKTTKITPPPITTTKPTPTAIRPKPVVEKKEENDGYKYPAPEVRLVLPTKPSPVVTKKVVDIPKPTYLPPVTTTKTTIKTTKITPPPITTTKPTPTAIRPKTVVEKKEENDGYKYPAPEVRLVLPTKPSPVVTKKVVDIPKPTYLPPVTTTKTTIKTTKITPPPVTTTKPAPTTIRPKPVVEKKEENDGYKYPAPEVRLVLPTKPSPVVTKKVVDIPKPTYLPPVTTTKTTIKTTKITPPPITTTKPTPTTTRPKIVVEKKEENDGYKYPAPEIRLKLPTELF